jgi:Cu-processing system ATP-binding protein
MVELRSLSKNFGSRKVLRSISLTTKPGEITAIAGPNGCGKTTLLKCVLGLVIPTEGEILIKGRAVDSAGEFRRLISYMPQYPDFPANLTLRELTEMIVDLRKENAPWRDELISYFDLNAVVNQAFGQLSGGTKQKFAAVLAFMFNTPLLILDEPSAGLDPLSNLKFKDLILKRKREGTTIVLVSHFMTEIQQLASELVFLHEGQLIYSGTIERLLKNSSQTSLERAVTSLFADRPARLR